MAIHGYPGGVISSTAPTISTTSASGVWTLDDQLQNANNWPSANNIARSLRFNSADSAYLSRTASATGSKQIFTFSGWIKLGLLGSQYASGYRLLTGPGSGIIFWLLMNSSDQLVIYTNGSGAGLTTTQVFRDVSSWYHIVIAVDTTQATSTNRIKLYINGSQVTAFSGTATYYAQNDNVQINTSGETYYIGANNTNTFNGYMADVRFIDGQALTPSSFGFFDSNNIWQPLNYAGAYGTNGFRLDFLDNSGTTATTLGKDTSGNGNNWTPNNFSVTAGAGNDSLVDTPTPYGSDTGAGGEVRGNIATWSPITGTSNVTLSNGNLDASTANTCHTVSTIGMTTGLWYWEITQIANGGNAGIYRFDAPVTNRLPNVANQAYVYNGNGYVYDGQANPVGSQYSTYTTNDVISFAFDATNGKLYVAKNGTWQNSGNPAAGTGAVVTGITTSSLWFAGVADGGGSTTSWTANFGQRPFSYTAPSGYKALCTTNLPTPTIQNGATAFSTLLYTGTGSTLSISGVGFQPDFGWFKRRNVAAAHFLFDAVRGAGKYLWSNATDAEGNDASATLQSFNSNGYTMGNTAGMNNNGDTYVVWNWKAGGTGVSNTAGSITSTVSANQTAGFSVVTYTGTGANATIGHGLGATPKIIIVKRRSSTGNWHSAFDLPGLSWSWGTDYLLINSTIAKQNNDPSSMFRQAPTSSVFSVGTNAEMNSSGGTFVAYCFSPVEGYSAFGSYTGNGSNDGVFVYTGIRPRYLMIKRTDNIGNWNILDTARLSYNIETGALYANASEAEGTFKPLDILSNGFKLRNNDVYWNTSGGTYLYMAFAENPFKIARAR